MHRPWLTIWLAAPLAFACDPGAPADAPLDADPVDAPVADADPRDAGPPDAAPWPPQPAVQTCAPAPIDGDQLPDLVASPAVDTPTVAGWVALHQPSISGLYWGAEATGRVLRVEVTPAGASLTLVTDLAGALGATRVLDVALAHDFGADGTLYSLTTRAGRVQITAHTIQPGTTWIAHADDRVLVDQPYTGATPGGGLAVSAAGVFAALPAGPGIPAGVWRVDGATPEALPGDWTAPAGCAPDAALGGLWCLDHTADGDALVRVVDDAATALITWPTTAECHRRIGPLYRGGELPALWGALLTLDPCAHTVHASRVTADGRVLDAPVWQADPDVTGFGVGWAARPLALGATGALRLREADPDHALGWPERLSDTGCFTSLPDLAPGPDLVPYGLNAPLWTDGAEKRRFWALPPGAALGVAADGRLTFPVGSVILKDFAFAGPSGTTRVETRVMSRRPFGWSFHTYRWDADGQDATLLPGDTATYRELMVPDGDGTPAPLTYLFPSRANCLTCHDPSGPSVLGPTLAQLRRPVRPGGPDQIDALVAAGLLVGPTDAPALVDPADVLAPLGERARAYLHGNCAHCHRPGGWTPPDLGMDLRHTTPLADAGVCGVRRRYTAFGIPGELRIDPGDPGNSNLLQRMLHRGFGQMPPVATERVDPRVRAVLVPWIEGLVCPDE